MAERYVVELELKKLGDFAFDKATRGASTLDDRINNLKKGFGTLHSGASSFIGVLDSAVVKTAKIGATVAAIGGAGAFAAVTYGVTSLNNQLEQTQLSLGAIFNAQGIARDVPAGVTLAKDQIAKMRADAKALPGEFEDLLNIFRLGATPAFQAGIDVDKWRQLSAQTMAAAKAVGTPLDQAARELTLLLEGRAGAQNTLGMKLGIGAGDAAEAFNKLDASKRVERLTKELGKYQAAIDLYGNSYDALSSTLIDNVKSFGIAATGPLFESIKDTLGDVNRWFDENELIVGDMATRIGENLQEAFEWGRRKIEEWGPLLINFAGTAYDRFTAFWKEVEPYAMRVAEYLKEALADPNGTIDKMLELLKLYAAIKVGQGVVETGIGIANTAVAARNIGSYFGKGAPAVVAAEAAPAAGAGAAVAGKGGLFAGFGGAGLLAGAAAIPTAAAGALYYAAFGGGPATVGGKEFESHSLAGWEDPNKERGARMATEMLERFEREGLSASEMQERVTKEMDYLRAQHQPLAAEMLKLQWNASGAAVTLGLLAKARLDNRDPAERANEGFLDRARVWLHNKDREEERKTKATAPKHRGGGGGTSIQKVEIVVTSNQNPDRIARAILGKMEEVGRHRRSSPYVQDFSRRDRI